MLVGSGGGTRTLAQKSFELILAVGTHGQVECSEVVLRDTESEVGRHQKSGLKTFLAQLAAVLALAAKSSLATSIAPSPLVQQSSGVRPS